VARQQPAVRRIGELQRQLQLISADRHQDSSPRAAS
jgi:hypothetical protein